MLAEIGMVQAKNWQEVDTIHDGLWLLWLTR